VVEALLDGVGSFSTLAEAYPDVPKEDWEQYRESYPELFAGDSWRIFCTCYLVRGRETVLIDTGIGPGGLWDWEPEWEVGLFPALAERGVQPKDIDIIVLTHPHIDHIGWNTDREANALFPRARYLLHEDSLTVARANSDRRHIQRCLLAIEDRLETFTEGEVSPGVEVVPLPGHAQGHVGVRAGREFIIGDAAPHPALLDHPEWRFVIDVDHEKSVETRRRLAAMRGEVELLCGHWPDGGRLR
jgi:glyoxylase-like metal-dependent hydrolase (beta-lactamase superfamily II)